MAKGDAARIWIGAWPTIPLFSIYPSSWASFGWVLGSQECVWEAHRLWDSLADKWSVYLWDKFSNCCLKCKIFWPALPPLGCDRRGIASDQWVCKQLYYTLLGQDMEEQANLKDLLKQYLQDFFSLPPTITPHFSAAVGKDFLKCCSLSMDGISLYICLPQNWYPTFSPISRLWDSKIMFVSPVG